MSGWLDPLRRALDGAPRPVRFFFRDDDVGWCDERLFELLDLFAACALPIDLAAIPETVTPGLAKRLRIRIDGSAGQIEIHQHGFAHVNHEPTGRKYEFGPSRPGSLQRRDIELGRRRLRDLLGPILPPIFTPPWNRCTAATAECLVGLGFQVLSRDASAVPIANDRLVELPIRVDWFAHRKGERLSRSALGRRLAGEVEASAAVGIMFHHALMDADERRAADELLGLLASHSRARCLPMATLAEELRGSLVSVEMTR
jgi:hypothetical protein